MELTKKQEDHLIESGMEEKTCLECGELWDSEYHISDVCVGSTND